MSIQSYLPDTVTATELRRCCGRLPGNDLRGLIHCYLRVWSKNVGKRPLLKLPAFVFHLDFVSHLFPDMHLFHIVRDPRANVFSQRSRWPHKSIWECAVWWRDAVKQAQKWKENGRTPYTELHYKELICHPQLILHRLCRDLGISYHPTVQNFELHTNLYTPDQAPQPITFTRVDPSRLNRWQQQLTPVEIKLMKGALKNI